MPMRIKSQAGDTNAILEFGIISQESFFTSSFYVLGFICFDVMLLNRIQINTDK
jgi:hypothetical protein